MTNYTIVTAFFDIGRGEWNHYTRNNDKYLAQAKRMLTLQDNMVIYIEDKFIDFVKEHRKDLMDKTKIVPMKIEELYAYKWNEQIQAIMNSKEYRENLRNPNCPEVNYSLYNVIMWSKIPLVVKTATDNPFNTDHFVWLDFGVYDHGLRDEFLGKQLFSTVPDRIKILCRSIPRQEDLDINTFFKSNVNRLAGTMLTGHRDYFIKFNNCLIEEIEYALSKNVVDCDQSFFAIAYLKHPDLFELYYGDWGQLVMNYYKTVENVQWLSWMINSYDGADRDVWFNRMKSTIT
jgi:protein YibB